MRYLLSIFLTVSITLAGLCKDNDYSDGIFFVNEDWYAHQNSSINFLRPDDTEGNYWDYRVFANANTGHELGCTNQYGAIFDGRFFLIAKQERDPGASITGGRITVADARTMKMLYQSALIDPTGRMCDGRAFVGYSPKKGYISTSHGVWVFNLESYKVTGLIAGTENPNGHTGTGNTDSSGSLYHGQCGTMIVTAGKLFVAHQQYGMLVIDPESDTLEATFTIPDKTAEGAGIGSIVLAKDGSLWLSVTKNTGGLGEMLNCLITVDPVTLEWKKIDLPEGIYPPASSWYAWTPDAFCSSAKNNVLYWNGGPNSWFSSSKIYRYDIDSGKCRCIINLDDGSISPWKLYGCSMRVHPETDELYMALFHEFGTPTYMVRRCDADGATIRDYPMIEHYWFPSLPVFATDKNTTTGLDGHERLSTPRFAFDSNGSISINDAEGLTLSIISLQGITVQEYHISDSEMTVHHDLAPGMYIVRLGSMSKKIIIR